jgi:hypothetical protein
MPPVECGGVTAKNGETREFTHIVPQGYGGVSMVYEFELVGYKDGGLAFRTGYLKYPLLPKSYIGLLTANVSEDEVDEKTFSDIGMVVKGTASENAMTWEEKKKIIENNKNWRP